jgi:hypothetical protein
MRRFAVVSLAIAWFTGAAAEAIRRVELPYGLTDEESRLVIRNADEWRAYVARHARDRDTPTSQPCDWSIWMLVAWRADVGESGCHEPESGISSAQELNGEYVVQVYVGMSEGACLAYFQPTVAACVPASALPVRFDGSTAGVLAP